MAGQNWRVPSPVGYSADGTALANSTTLTSISPTLDTVPAIYWPLVVGSKLFVTAFGEYSTTGTPTLKLGLYWGGTGGVDLGDTGALTTISAASHTSWKLEAEIDVRVLGTSGSVFCQGAAYGLTAASSVALIPATTPAASTVDTTPAGNKALVLGATWGTASASNTITCHQWTVESAY